MTLSFHTLNSEMNVAHYFNREHSIHHKGNFFRIWLFFHVSLLKYHGATWPEIVERFLCYPLLLLHSSENKIWNKLTKDL